MSDEVGRDGLGARIEADWLERREDVFSTVDRVVREAIDQALRANREARLRAVEDAEREVAALAEQRDALLVEVEQLRSEAHVLEPRLTAARQELQELERRRGAVEDIHRALVRDAEVRRSQMLGEVESLARQVTEMRSNLLGLLAAVDAAAALPQVESSSAEVAGPSVAQTLGSVAAATVDEEEASPFATATASPALNDVCAEAAVAVPAIGAPRSAPSRPESLAETAPIAEPSSNGDDSLPVFELPEPDGAAGDAAPTEPQLVNVKITNLSNLAEGMQIRKAMRNLPGILSLSFPQFRDGTMTMTIRHERGAALVADVTSLRDANLTLVREAGDTIELCVAS
jgi:hypothetical protein